MYTLVNEPSLVVSVANNYESCSHTQDAVKTLMESFGLREEDYSREMTEAHLEEFTHDYGENWRTIHAHLDIKSIVARDIDRKENEGEKRYAFFIKWKSLKCSGATYKKLVYALLKINCRNDAEAVCVMLRSSLEPGSNESSESAPIVATGR